MKKLYLFGILALGALSAAPRAEAQGMFPLAVEIRGGAAFPMGDFASENGYDASTGVSYGANAQLRLIPALAVYAGYERSQFDLAGNDVEATDDGFAVGGQLSLPIGMLTGFSPWVRAGGIYNKFDTEGTGGAAENETDRTWGYEVGGGISIPLGMVISVTPGVRYRSYSPDLGGVGTDADTDISYLVADVSMKFTF